MEINYKDTMTDKQKKDCLEVSDLLKKYNITSIEEIQGCTLAEFLAKQHPEKYDNSIYQNTDELKQIFAVVNKKENVAIFINLNKDNNSKLEYGDFAEQDLNTYKIKLAPEIEEKFKLEIEQMSHDYFSIKEQEKIFKESFKGDLDSLEKTATIYFYLIHRAKKIISEKLDEVNRENGISKDEREKIESKGNEIKLEKEEHDEYSKEVNIVNEENKDDEKNEIPVEVREACRKLGINKIKGYFYVNASELHNKVDNTLVDKYGEKVLMLQVPSEKIEGPDKYYGMQDEKMVLYGNEDEAVRDVTGKTRMGEVVEPLKLQEPKAVEYSDDDGLVINEQIDDNSELSVQEANNYREEMEELLEKYSQNVEMIENDTSLSLDEKTQMLNDMKNKFCSDADRIADKYDIKSADTKNIMIEMEEHTEEEIDEETEEEQLNRTDDDEPDYFEVPGKRTH